MTGPGWYLLIHQLPPRPLYLRAKIRNRLAKVGAVALKNSVYVLPLRDDCLEDLQWIAQEAEAGGGEAFVCRAAFAFGVTDEALVEEFRRQSAAAYRALGQEIARFRAGGGQDAAGALLRFKKRLEEVAAGDFFGAPGRKEILAMMRAHEGRVRARGAKDAPRARRPHRDLAGRTWVTRRDPKVDRLATAWLVRRFVDPRARFRFIDPARETKRPREIGFDMVGGDFTHEADRCTFETLVRRLGITDPALREVAEIVHDLDLKDGKYARPDAPGVRQLIEGLVRAHGDDHDRLKRGLAFFDDLYASFSGKPGKKGRK